MGAPGDEQQLLSALQTLASRTALANGKQPTPMHRAQFKLAPLADVDALLAEAEEVAPDFHVALKNITQMYGGEYLQGPNKGRARAVEKCENDYGGDHTKLVDVVRASAIFTSFVQLTSAVQALLREGSPLIVVRAKDRFNNPTDFGYKDVGTLPPGRLVICPPRPSRLPLRIHVLTSDAAQRQARRK